MPYYYDLDEPEQGNETIHKIMHYTGISVRLLGVLLLLVGFVVGIQVVVEAWDLYRSPEHIERMAWSIEKGSNLDKLLAPAPSKVAPAPDSTTGETATPLGNGKKALQSGEAFRPSYFLAWLIALMLLMLIGTLAFAAVRTGGQLALYDTEVKKLVKALLRELKDKDGDDTEHNRPPLYSNDRNDKLPLTTQQQRRWNEPRI